MFLLLFLTVDKSTRLGYSVITIRCHKSKSP
nr:MAG TPA: hypothetical protein [Caudoviricetes sp.]